MKPERWSVIRHAEVQAWYDALDSEVAARVQAAVDLLSEHGPGLGRPYVDGIETSRHSNMRELRTGTVRVLFAFDPRRQAILLVAGDKRGEWNRWYRRAVRVADERFDQWLNEMR